MTEHEITYRIYPPGRVHTEIERDPTNTPTLSSAASAAAPTWAV